MAIVCSSKESAQLEMLKRIVDIAVALTALILLSPLLLTAALLVFLEDGQTPIYSAVRVGRGETKFTMRKFRTMTKNTDALGPSSTSADDPRITKVGNVLRKTKFDETLQFLNVLKGDMSLVGPRPQIPWAVGMYTNVERELLQVKPGITDFASIVFADEGEILGSSDQADLLYSQLIRPGKSALGLHYVHHRSLLADCQILIATFLNSISRQHAIRLVQKILRNTQANQALIQLAGRTLPLVPAPPPGSDEVVSLIPPK